MVKNATRHTEETANVTRWWDINEKKTAIQTAREEKLAKEAKELKLAQDTKLAQEAKILMAKAAASALTQVKPPVVTAPLVLKPVELTPAPVAAIKTSTPTPVPEALRFVSGSQPNFPATAARAGHTQGFVIARLSIEKNGSVSKVEIIDSNPKKVFDKEVVNALSFWKYAAISTPQTKMVELQFKTDN